MLHNFSKYYKFSLLLLFLFFLITDNQSYKILYGEDATWINNFLEGNLYESLFPRGNFLVLGASLPQVVSLSISKNLSQFAFLKYLLSYSLIFLISISNFLNKFLAKKTQFLLSVFCFVPLSKSIDFEVYGHLHNLVWYYPLLTINLLCYIFYQLTDKNIHAKQGSIRLFNLIFIFFLITSFLFPICAILVLISQIFFLIIKTNHLDNKLFINKKFIVYSSIITLLIYLINLKDRSVSIIDSSTNNADILKYYEFLIRILNEPFTSLFTHNNYLGSDLLMWFSVFVISIMIFGLYLDVFLNSFKYFLKAKKPNLTKELVNLFLIILLISNIIIFSYTRFPELSFFLSGLTNSAYPERYYLFQNHINTIIVFTILTNTISIDYLDKSLSNMKIYFGKYSKLSIYKIQKKLFTTILLFLIIISIASRFGILFLKNVDANRFIYSSCKISADNIFVDGFPKIFKTVIPKESHYFKNALDKCTFNKAI